MKRYLLDTNILVRFLVGDSHMPGIECPTAEYLTDALLRFASTKVDFIDCYLAALSKKHSCGIASFDRDFRKFKDIELWDQSSTK